jgi:hypothetical protein
MSLYDYSDKSVEHAGYAAIAYAVINLFTGLLAWIQFMLYHRPRTGGFLHHDFVSEQWVQHTLLITAVAVACGAICFHLRGPAQPALKLSCSCSMRSARP